RQHSPVKASKAHVSIVGHITAEELRRYLSNTEAASGFGNRFLWVCVRRSKCLPEGGTLIDLEPLAKQLATVIGWARTVEQMHRDEDARELWHEVYAGLSEASPAWLVRWQLGPRRRQCGWPACTPL